MHPEILYFGYFEDEKIVFEVGSLNFKNLEKWQIFHSLPQDFLPPLQGLLQPLLPDPQAIE